MIHSIEKQTAEVAISGLSGEIWYAFWIGLDADAVTVSNFWLRLAASGYVLLDNGVDPKAR